MKEQEPNGKDELTRQDNQPRLKEEGAIIMPENGEGPKPGDIEKGKTPDRSKEETKDKPITSPSSSGGGKKPPHPPLPTSSNEDDLGKDDDKKGKEEATPEEILEVIKNIEETLEQRTYKVLGKINESLGKLEKLAGTKSAELLQHTKKMADAFEGGEKLGIYQSMEGTFRHRDEGVSPKEIIDYISSGIDGISSSDQLQSFLRGKSSLFTDIKERKTEDDLITLIGLARNLSPETLGKIIKSDKDNNNFHTELNKKLDKVSIMLEEIRAGRYSGNFDEDKKALKELIDGFDINIVDKGENITIKKGLSDIYLERELIEEDIMPRCLEDLAKLVMYTEVDEFKTGGVYELIDKNGEVKIENFVAWIRSRIIYQHDTYSDSEIDLFSGVNIFKMYRTITFGEMLADPRYFMKEEKIDRTRFEQKTAKDYQVARKEYIDDKEYQEIKDHLLYEVWLTQMAHNFDVKYRKVMGIEKKVPEVLAEINYDNIFTKYTNRLAMLMRLADIGSGYEDFKKSADIGINEGEDFFQGKTGLMFQRATLAYYHLAEVGAIEGRNYKKGDKNMFEKSLGEKGTLRFYKTILKELKGIKEDDLSGAEDIEKETDIKKLKDAVAELIYQRYEKNKDVENDKIKMDEFREKYLSKLNFFSLIEKEMSIEKMVKKGIRKATAEETGIKETRGVKDGSILSVNIQYAANLAETMIYWTGISARNDTMAIGHDSWSKLINGQWYRVRQVGKNMGGRGVWGDLASLFGFQRFGFNFWEGMKVHRSKINENGESLNELEEIPLIQVLQGGEGNKVNIGNGKLKKYEFKTNAQRQYAANHILNTYKVFNSLQRDHGLNHDRILATDPKSGRIIVDKIKADEIIWDGFFKALRYQLDLQEFIWGAKTRGWWTEEKDGKDVVVFGEKTFDELFFSDGMRSMEMYDGTEIEKRYKSGNRARMAYGYLLAQDIFAHRFWLSPDGYKKYTSSEIEAIAEYYCHLRPTDLTREKGTIYINRGFFTKKEMKQILARGRAKLGSIYAKELSSALSSGSFVGLFQSLGKLLAYIAK